MPFPCSTVLHWFSMFLWLISPKNVFHGERISRLKKTTLGGLIAFVYIFAYINLQEVRHRQKMVSGVKGLSAQDQFQGLMTASLLSAHLLRSNVYGELSPGLPVDGWCVA